MALLSGYFKVELLLLWMSYRRDSSRFFFVGVLFFARFVAVGVEDRAVVALSGDFAVNYRNGDFDAVSLTVVLLGFNGDFERSGDLSFEIRETFIGDFYPFSGDLALAPIGDLDGVLESGDLDLEPARIGDLLVSFLNGVLRVGLVLASATVFLNAVPKLLRY